MGMLLPVLHRGTSASRRISCMSNQRQLVAAWLQYTSEYRGLLPLAWPDGLPGPNTIDGNYIPWVIGVKRAAGQPWLVANVGGDAKDKFIRGGCLFKYLRDTRVYRCPDNPVQFDLNIHYGLNGFLNGELRLEPPRLKLLRIAQIRRPANIFLSIDQEDDDFDGDIKGILCVDTTYWEGGTGQPAPVHDHGSVISFVDGHVDYIKWPTPRVTKTEVGMLKPFRGF